jgi:tripartite-type tricarboxylate transporter receptor subunit TctC
MGVSTLAINPATYRKMPYDAIARLRADHAGGIRAQSHDRASSVPARSVKEMIALAKARPGEILFASAGHGTNPHLSMELFATMAQIRMIHVPYKSSTPGSSI